MLVLCIMMASFVAALSFDMTNSLKNILREAFSSAYGTSNVMVASSHGIDEKTFENTEKFQFDYTLVAMKNSSVSVRSDDMYAYFNQKTLKTSAADLSHLNDMHLLAFDVTLNEKECAISKKMAEELGYKRGDTIVISGDNDVPVEFTVKEILPYKGVIDSGMCALVNEEGMKRLSYNGNIVYGMAYIHMENEKDLPAFCEQLRLNDPYAEVEDLVTGKNVTSQVSEISAIFYFLFLICLLLVVFVTISLSERIMVERMATVGTLRSLGVSVRATTLIVLLENVLYGLLGGTIGVTLYALTRDPIFNSVFTLNSGSDIQMEMNLGHISFLAMAGVVAGTILIECLCPIKELLRAVKTPIRDIIFDNKDTEFKYSRKTFVASLLLAIIGLSCLVLGRTILSENILVLMVAWLFPIAALFLGYPHLLRGICRLLAGVFEKHNKPLAQLACVEASTKKASVGNSRLCVMAVTICLILFSMTLSYKELIDWKEADCDVVVSGLTEESVRYDFIKDLDGVSDVELLYVNYSDDLIIGTDRIEQYLQSDAKAKIDFEYDSNSIVGANGPMKMNRQFLGVKENLADDEILITARRAEKLGLKVGDSIEILFKARSVIPVRLTLKVAGIFESTYYDGSNRAMMLSENTYKKVFFDSPSVAYVKCDDPEAVIKQISQYASSIIDEALTSHEREVKSAQSNAGLSTILYALITMGVALSLIAVVSNQTVGFEGRKRECAVLISTSMSRRKLIRTFLMENLLSASIAILVAAVLALTLLPAPMNMIRIVSIELPAFKDAMTFTVFAVGMFLIFTMTVLSPIRHLRKMKTAEQLKYE